MSALSLSQRPTGRQRQRGSGSATRRVEKKCEHNRRKSQFKDCGGASICQHNRRRPGSTCKDCGGASICQHNRERSRCKDCGGTGICQHDRISQSNARTAGDHNPRVQANFLVEIFVLYKNTEFLACSNFGYTTSHFSQQLFTRCGNKNAVLLLLRT